MFGSLLIAERPCTRCVKKGIGDSCVEGVRKKAKYLLEGDERGESGDYIDVPLPCLRCSENYQIQQTAH